MDTNRHNHISISFVPSAPRSVRDLVVLKSSELLGSLIQISDHSSSQVDTLITESMASIEDWSKTLPRTPKKKITGNQILSAILSNRFARNKGEPCQARLRAVERALIAECPIPISILCGPLKNRRLNVPQQPDWAELFLFSHLAKIAEAVKEIYAPGIQVEIILDDARASFANDIPEEIFLQYRQAMIRLLESINLDSSKIKISSQKPIYERLEVLNHLDAARIEVDKFRNSYTGQCCWEKISRNSCENNCNESNCEAAAVRYLVAQKAEIMAGFWQNSERVMLRYGQSPEFVPRLWTIRKGSMGLPWQGFGAILKLESGELRPAVWQPYRACGITHLGWATSPVSNPYLPAALPVISEENCPADKADCGECPNK